MTHLAMAFTIAHPGVTSALLGARTTDHLDGLDQAYQPPALENPGLRRRPLTAPSAA
jgi:aryl-alcohol dehydrogenase (NADP+)